MSDANALNIPSIGPISNTASGTFSSSYNKFYQPGFANLGIAFSGTTLTVQSEGGTSMSSTNPGFVALQSLVNPGRIKRYSITANQTFTQAGLGNNLFGLTTAIDTTVDIPFFLYAVSNSNNGENAIAFMISRIPHLTLSPVAANIGQSGNTNATTQGSMFSLATITAADYASSPCLCVGSFRMRYASSLWTVQALSATDGLGAYQEGILFSFPISQFGAASGKVFANNGGTAPHDTAYVYQYYVQKNGFCIPKIAFPSVTTAGVGAVNAVQVLPLAADGATIGNGNFSSAGTIAAVIVAAANNSNLANQLSQDSNLGSGFLTNANFTIAALYGTQCIYMMSKS